MSGESDRVYRQLYESIRDGIVSTDLEGRIRGANLAYQEMLGYSLDELKQLTYIQLTPERWHAMEAEIVSGQIRARGYSDEYEKEYIRKDGSVFPISLRTWLITDENGQPVGMWAIVRDISERKAYERQIAEARANWEKTFESVSDAMILVDLDLNILQHNTAFGRLVERESQDLRGQKCYELVHGMDQPPDFCVTCASAREGNAVSAELYEPYLDKFIDASADPTFDDNGDFEFALHIIRDITTRKRAQEEVEEKFATFKGVIDNLDYPIFSVDTRYRYTSFNKSHAAVMKSLYGCDIQLGDDLLGCMTVDGDRAKAKENIDGALAGEATIQEAYSGEDALSRIYVEVRHQPILDDGGSVIGVAMSVRDLTERRRAEEALRESEERYRQIFEHAFEGIFQSTPAGGYLSVNPAFATMFGYDTPEQMEKEVTDIAGQLYVDPADREEMARQIEEGPIVGREIRFKKRDGSTLWVVLNAHLVRDDAGEAVYFEGTVADITERRAVEEHLRLARFELDNAGDMILRTDASGRLLSANDAACRRYGASLEEVLRLHLWDIDSNLDRARWGETWSKWKEQGQARMETVFRRADGQTYPVGLALTVLEFEGREFLVAFGRDITERKMAEEELAEAERRYRELAETLPQVVFEIDFSGRVTYVNPGALEMFGLTQEDFDNGIYALDIIEEVDKDRVTGAIDKMMDGRSDGAVREYQARRKDGSAFPVMVYSSLIADECGARSGIRGILTDISERKELEMVLEASERKYRELANSLPEVVFEIEKNGVFTYVNESGAARFGYEVDEIVGKITPLDILAPEDRGKAIDMMRRVLEEGSAPPTEFTVFNRDGSPFPAVIFGNLSTRDGEPFGMSGLVMDISERKRYEEELQKANVELEGFAHTVSHDLRGPLTVIGFASELIQQNIGQPQTEEVDGALEEATRLLVRNVAKSNALIEDLLSLAHAGQTPSGVTDVDVAETVESVLDENAASLRRKGIRVEVDDDLGTIRANPTHVYQVFANLVGNAVSHGSGSGTIEVRRLPNGRRSVHRFLVRDDGAGIDPEILEKIFIPFYKGEDGGTGIGLSTVQKAVRAYGGWIRAYNDDGACFEFVMNDWQEE